MPSHAMFFYVQTEPYIRTFKMYVHTYVRTYVCVHAICTHIWLTVRMYVQAPETYVHTYL